MPRGRTGRSSWAAVSAVSPRGAPAGSSWASSACSRFTVWVRVLTTSSRCSTRARSAVTASSTVTVRSPAALWRPPPPRSRRRRRSCGRARWTASGRGRRAWRARPPRRSRRRTAGWPGVRPARRRPRSPTRRRASGRRSGAGRGSPRVTGTRIVASGRSPGPTAAAVHDALCGSTPITIRSDSLVLSDTQPPRRT